jgi:uncharacterized protein (TIGR03084 family)
MEGGAIAPALARLAEEAEALDALLEQLADDAFGQTTPFYGWTIGDVVRHFIVVDWQARLAMTDVAAFAEAMQRLRQGASTPVAGEPQRNESYFRLRNYERTEIGMLPRAELIARWHDGRRQLFGAAAMETEDRKIGWYGPPMRISRLLAARLMEYWCYGQDLYDALRVKRPNRDHIHSVADFGVRTRGFSFSLHGLEAPEMPRIELVAPSGQLWVWGDADAHDRIRGEAEQFCLVVTQRRNIADTQLQVTGAGANKWMDICQTIAGAVHYPPGPGERVWK